MYSKPAAATAMGRGRLNVFSQRLILELYRVRLMAELQAELPTVSYWFDRFGSHPSRRFRQSRAILISGSESRALPLGWRNRRVGVITAVLSLFCEKNFTLLPRRDGRGFRARRDALVVHQSVSADVFNAGIHHRLH
jgi:hypothetical protein